MEAHEREELESEVAEEEESVYSRFCNMKGRHVERVGPGLFKIVKNDDYKPQSAWETVKGVFGVKKD